jgi:hypothetical protein
VIVQIVVSQSLVLLWLSRCSYVAGKIACSIPGDSQLYAYVTDKKLNKFFIMRNVVRWKAES